MEINNSINQRYRILLSLIILELNNNSYGNRTVIT